MSFLAQLKEALGIRKIFKTVLEDSTSSKENELKIISDKIYRYYIYETIVLLGCLLRWSSREKGVKEIVDCIIRMNLSKSLLSTLSVEEKNLVFLNLEQLISDSYFWNDVTIIKACIRTLLRSSRGRREALVDSLGLIVEDAQKLSQATSTLQGDLMKASNELGYPIPVMPAPNRDRILEIKKQKRPLMILSIGASMRLLSNCLNDGKMLIEKEEFEAEVRMDIASLYSSFAPAALEEMTKDQIESGISMSYLFFGINRKNNSLYSNSDNLEIVDLRNSKAN